MGTPPQGIGMGSIYGMEGETKSLRYPPTGMAIRSRNIGAPGDGAAPLRPTCVLLYRQDRG